MKSIRYFIEYIVVWLLYTFFRALPYKTASNIGGFLGRHIGFHLSATRKAKRHIRLAFPKKTDEEVRQIARDMWDNLGRVFAEYPHLDEIAAKSAHCPDINKIEVIKNDDKPAIFCGAHIGNWEVGTYFVFQAGVTLPSVYRRPNNPYVAKLLQHMRGAEKMGALEFEKSLSGMIQIVRALKKGAHIGMLVDQKFNEGIKASFFGHDAMTSSAFVELAQKFKCPLYFGRVVRHDKTEFTLHISDEIPVFHDDGSPIEAIEIINEYHRYLEQWITENPGQWLWLHRRWKGI